MADKDKYLEQAEVIVERLRDADYDGYGLSMERAADEVESALRSAADEREREVIERCAKVCGNIVAEYRARASERRRRNFHGTADSLQDVAEGAEECETKIRALASGPEKGDERAE